MPLIDSGKSQSKLHRALIALFEGKPLLYNGSHHCEAEPRHTLQGCRCLHPCVSAASRLKTLISLRFNLLMVSPNLPMNLSVSLATIIHGLLLCRHPTSNSLPTLTFRCHSHWEKWQKIQFTLDYLIQQSFSKTDKSILDENSQEKIRERHAERFRDKRMFQVASPRHNPFLSGQSPIF